MPAYTPIFIICGLAAADADHASEFVVVLLEEGDHGLLLVIAAEIHLLDHHRSNEGLFVKERVVASFDVEPDIGQLFVDADGHAASSRDPSLRSVPTEGSDRETCGKLRPLSVDRDTSHNRDVSVPQRRILLDVE